MRFHLKCSCGAEATWETTENEPDAAVEASAQVDRWLAEHECREAGIQRKPGVIFTKAESMPDVYAKPPEPAKECEHVWTHKSNTAGKYVECQKCYKRDVL